MKDVETLKGWLQRALAHAHAALDDRDPARVEEARALAQDVLSLVGRKPPKATLADGHALVVLAGRLRDVMAALDRGDEAHA